MKNLFLILILTTLVACNSSKEELTIVSVMADRTDPAIPAPDANTVSFLFDMDIMAPTGAFFRYQNVGNTDINSTYSTELPSHSSLGNKLIRKSEVGKFFKRIDTLLFEQNNREFNYRSSSIFVPVLDELKVVKAKDATVKVVALWSDLAEISDLFNILSTRNRRNVIEHPEVVAEHFKTTNDIPDLSGVILYLSYQPITNEENRVFRGMCRVYREVFKDSGLEIRIGIDNQIPK